MGCPGAVSAIPGICIRVLKLSALELRTSPLAPLSLTAAVKRGHFCALKGEPDELVRLVVEVGCAELHELDSRRHPEIVNYRVGLLDDHHFRRPATDAPEDGDAPQPVGAPVPDLGRAAVLVGSQLLMKAVREEHHQLPLGDVDNLPHVPLRVESAHLTRP